MEKVIINNTICNGCGLCVPVCPDQTIILEAGRATIRGEKCMECGHCLAACPQGAITIPAISNELGFHHFKEKAFLRWARYNAPSFRCLPLCHPFPFVAPRNIKIVTSVFYVARWIIDSSTTSAGGLFFFGLRGIEFQSGSTFLHGFFPAILEFL